MWLQQPLPGRAGCQSVEVVGHVMVSLHGAAGERDWLCCLGIWYPRFPCINHPRAPVPMSTSGFDDNTEAVVGTGAALRGTGAALRELGPPRVGKQGEEPEG